MFGTDYANACFLRAADIDIKLCLLFELVLIVKKVNESEPNAPVETIEVSCGWSLLPLFTTDGNDLESKTYDMQVFGGNPSERDVILAEPIVKNTGFFSRAPLKSPRISIKIWKPKKSVLNEMKYLSGFVYLLTIVSSDLPDVLLGNLPSVPLLSFYRRVLANTLIGQGKEAVFGSRYEPILALVPVLLEQCDFLEHLVTLWTKKLKGMPSKDKKSYQALKNHFQSAVLTIWPLLFLDVPVLVPGNTENAIIRSELWYKIQAEGVIACLSKPNTATKQFNMKELEYNYLVTYKSTSVY